MDRSSVSLTYIRATHEETARGMLSRLRPEPTLDEARTEFSEAISRVASHVFRDKYGPLLESLSQPALNEFLKFFESNLLRAKGDLTIVFEEIIERIGPVNKKMRNRRVAP